MKEFSDRDYDKIYKAAAHVFELDPETKESWVPKANQTIPIALVVSAKGENSVDIGDRVVKLIATDHAGIIVLESTILPRTVFTRRSEKFGQWDDKQTGSIYGLGFNSEPEIENFIETFKRVQQDLVSQHPTSFESAAISRASLQSQRQLSSATSNVEEDMRNASLHSYRDQQYSQSRSATLAHQGHRVQHHIDRLAQNSSQYNNNLNTNTNNGNNNGNNNIVGYPSGSQINNGVQQKQNAERPLSECGRKTSPENEHFNQTHADLASKHQLKYENERLKLALEESSKNSGLWQSELNTLRTNNLKLTQALKESKAHVGEWNRQLMNLSNENKELKLKLLAAEAAVEPEKASEFKRDVQKYKEHVEILQNDLRSKEITIEDLQRALEEIEKNDAQTDGKSGGSEISDHNRAHHKSKFEMLHAKLESKIAELGKIEKDFSELVNQL